MSQHTGPDERHLTGFDPYDELDAEAARLEAYLGGLDDAAWTRPSRCAGWRVRDVVAHLAGVEQYHHACLDGRVKAFVEEAMATGMTSLDEFNQAGVDERADRAPAEVVAEWATGDAETRRRFREGDGGDIDSMVGPYPLRWQAFHVATELATHADDMAMPIAGDEAADRLAWRTAFSRFALTEKNPGATVEAVPGGTRVAVGDVDVVVDDETLVAGLVDRLDDDDDPAVRAALSATN